MRLPTDTEDKIELQMGPMIDIIFQLIIFFLCASTFNPTENELKVNLPTTPSEAVSAKSLDDVTIYITKNGSVVVNNKEYDSKDSRELPQVIDMLTKLHTVFPDQGVIIQPEKGVRHGRVVEVLNACASSGITDVSFYASG
jgi:biopolymer transport protein ExbD